MIKSVVMLVSMLSLSGVALAECPSNLEASQLIECITIEGSGSNYQDWQKQYEALADSSVTSPVTGESVVEVKPAAGNMAK